MTFRKLLGIFGPLVLVVGCAQSDAGITTSVKSKMVADDLVKARTINVDTKDHVVTLAGTVQSREEENQALQIARNTKGVSNVVDNLTVQGEQNAAPTSGIEPTPMTTTPGEAPMTGTPPIGEGAGSGAPAASGDVPAAPMNAPASAGDSDVNAQVKSALMADRSFNGQAITVDVKNGVATLTGTVNTAADKTKAGDIAGKVANVTRVDNQITVKGK